MLDDALELYNATTTGFEDLIVIGAFALTLRGLLRISAEHGEHDLVKEMRERIQGNVFLFLDPTQRLQ